MSFRFPAQDWDINPTPRPPGVRAPLCHCALRTTWRLNWNYETPKLLVYESGQDSSFKLLKVVKVLKLKLRGCRNLLVIATCFGCPRLHLISAYLNLHIPERSANQVEFPQQLLVLVLCFIDTPRYSALVC